MHMMFATPCEEYEPNPVLVRALDRILILHADHEQNASTSTVRLAGSSRRQSVRLHRRRHRLPVGAGARRRQRGRAEDAGRDRRRLAHRRIHQARQGQERQFRLMGFGHRVYKNYDPRAKLMRETCHEVLNELGLENDRLFKLAMELERIALEDEYFVDKKLYPNVDFYSGIVQRALGIPVSMFTGDLRAGAHRRLDLAVERDDRRSGAQDRAPAPAVHRAPTRAAPIACVSRYRPLRRI